MATDASGSIDHLVVLMMENRSFDNLLGWLYEDRAPRDGQPFDGLTSDLWCPLANSDRGRDFTERVYVRRNGEVGRGRRWQRRRDAALDFTSPNPDPGEGYRATNHQLFGGYDVDPDLAPEPTMTGFVDDYQQSMLFATYQYGDDPADPRDIMTTYTPEQTPVLSTLARQFAVSDRWFASVPSQTLPNRDFVHAATSNGRVANSPNGVCRATTIFEKLDDAPSIEASGLTPWRVYSGSASERHFSLTRTIMGNLQHDRYADRFRHIDRFAADAADGDLPAYTFLEPNFHAPGQNDQKPPSDIRSGEAFMARVYEAIRSSPRWEHTLLVITYDEHGGCYDHVPPPGNALSPEPERPEGEGGFRFDRFGVRVPAVLVSPWIEAGTVARAPGETPFDHTSILATLRARFDVPALTRRDAAAPDLWSVLTRSAPRTDRVEVHPLPVPADAEAPSHPPHELTRAIADALSLVTGTALDELVGFDHELSHAVLRTYHEHFHANR